MALTCEKGPAQFRLATDIFAAPRFRIDMGASYALSRYATLYFDAKNLTDTPLQFTEGPTNSRPIQREFYDATYPAGLRGSFRPGARASRIPPLAQGVRYRAHPLLIACCLLAAGPAVARDTAPFTLVQSTKLGAPERWDYVQFDPAGRRVFVAHGDRTDVVDGRSGRVLGHVGPLEGAHGTAIAAELHRGFADSGLSRTLTVFDLDSLKPRMPGTATSWPACRSAPAATPWRSTPGAGWCSAPTAPAACR